MTAVRTILSLLGSAALTRAIAGLFVLSYLTAAVWSGEAFASFVTHLAGNNAFRALYGLFLVNIALRSAASLRLRWGDPLRFLPRAFLSAGIVVLLSSFGMSVNLRDTVQLLVSRGDRVEIPWENTLFRITAIDPALQKHALRTGESLVFDYEPGVMLAADGGRTYHIGAFPPVPVRSSWVHILNFGIAPFVELRDAGATVFTGYVPLRLTPFGSADRFDAPPSPYRFFLSILPNRIVKKGETEAREYELDSPVYEVTIAKADKVVFRGRSDRPVVFDGTQELRFRPPEDWVLLEAVHDPFLPGIVSGIGLLFLGAVAWPVTLFGRRRRVGPDHS